jgi:hypothetical protein
MSRNPGKNIGGREETDSLLFHDVEIRSEEIPSRARSIAIWIALFVCAILVSQFGRPSRAREAEFLHSAAKVEALGRSRPGSAPATLVHDNNAAHSMEAREATPAVYVSKKYGVAWQYPRTYVLRKGANANLNLAGQPAAASAFTGSGGVALATVNIPALLYPGTDFKSGSLTVRVNSQISEEACGQFGISDADGGQGESFPGTEVTVGTIDFAETGVNVDDASNAPGVATQERFYHAYDNDACYEFAMSVSTAAGQAPGAQVAVERDEIFERLTEILTSVTIVPRNGQAVTASGANHLPR